MKTLLALLLFIPTLCFADTRQEVVVTVKLSIDGYGHYPITWNVAKENEQKILDICGIDQKEIDARAKDVKTARDYELAHPPVYQEPSAEVYLEMYNAKIAEATEYFTKYSEKETVTAEDIQKVKDNLVGSVTAIDEVITEKSK